MSGRAKRLSRAPRLLRWLAGLAGIGIGATMPVAAQTMTLEQAPVEWVRYAEGATQAVTGWLRADSDAGKRLRAYLDAARPAPDQPTAPLVIKLWIDGEGSVSRIDFSRFAQTQANADLRALVVGRRLPGTPPKNMLLPLRIAVQLDAPAMPPVEPATERAPEARIDFNRT